MAPRGRYPSCIPPARGNGRSWTSGWISAHGLARDLSAAIHGLHGSAPRSFALRWSDVGLHRVLRITAPDAAPVIDLAPSLQFRMPRLSGPAAPWERPRRDDGGHRARRGGRAGPRRQEGRAAHHPPQVLRRQEADPKGPSMLDPHRAAIGGWLGAEAAITAVNVPARPKARHPERFTDTHRRIIRRMVKTWREERAERAMRCGTQALGPCPPQRLPGRSAASDGRATRRGSLP